MAEKKLTKVQKEILTTLRDVPGAEIRDAPYSVTRLHAEGRASKGMRYETFRFIRIWLKEAPKPNGYGQYVYTLKPDTEISDAWRQAETERIRAENEAGKIEGERRLAEVMSQLEVKHRQLWKDILAGQAENVEIGHYGISFTVAGQKYFIRED